MSLISKRGIGLILGLFCFVQIATAQLRVAITNFENQTDVLLLDAWARNLPDYLGIELGASPQITLLERNRLKEIFAEMHLALSGFVQDSALVEKIGKLAGADVIISGVITQVEDHYVILAHITRVKTTEVMVEKVEAPDVQHFKEMVQLLGNNIRFRLTGEGTYQTKRALKRYPTTYFLLGTIVSGVVAGVLEHQSQKAYDDYHSAVSLKDFDTYYDRANQLKKWSNAFVALAGAGLVGTIFSWLKNMKQADLKAGSQPAVSVDYQWNFQRKGVRFGLAIHF